MRRRGRRAGGPGGVHRATGMGREYVRAVSRANGQSTQYDAGDLRPDYQRAEQAQPGQTEYRFSMPRTVGLWLAAFFTLAIFSFLYARQPVLQSRRVGARRRVGGVLDGRRFLGCARAQSVRAACRRRLFRAGRCLDSRAPRRSAISGTSCRWCSASCCCGGWRRVAPGSRAGRWRSSSARLPACS